MENQKITAHEQRNTLCRMCGEHCAVKITLDEGKMAAIEGYAPHPWNRGATCNKSKAAIAMAYHPERILHPLKKVDGGWEPIELGQALDEIAEKLVRIGDKFGARSVGVWKGEALGFAQEADLYRRFIHAFGSPNYFSSDSACYVGRYMGYRLGFGVYGVPDFENSRCIVLWGSNPSASHPAMTQYIQRARKNGAEMVVIDPRKTGLGGQTDLYLPVKPGADGCLALGLARILIEKGWYDQEFIANYCVGFEQFAAHVVKFTTELVEQETGVPADALEQMAKMLHKAAPQVTIYVGNGLEHHAGGVQAIRAIALLDALLGSFDRPGGTRWVEPLDTRELTLHQDFPLLQLEPVGAKEFPVTYDFRQESNTMRAMDMIQSGQPYPLKAIILSAANPVLSNPNSQKVKKSLSALKLFVVRDLFMTKTAELADYVLPAATFLERSEIHCHGTIQVANLTRRIFSIPGVQDEYQFLRDLAYRLKMEKYFPWRDEDELNSWLLEPTGIGVDDLRGHPEGIQYKPIRYEKWRDTKLPTPSGKVEFVSQYLKDLDLPELPDYLPTVRDSSDPDNDYPYLLISGIRKPFSTYGNCRDSSLLAAIPEMEMNPMDAKILRLQDGDLTKVSSRIGSVKLKVKLIAPAAICPGCVAVGQGLQGIDINEITIDDTLDPLDGFPILKSVPVKIEKW